MLNIKKKLKEQRYLRVIIIGSHFNYHGSRGSVRSRRPRETLLSL